VPTPTPQEIADLVQQADDAASKAAGRMTDTEALAAKDSAITAKDAALTAALAAKGDAEAKVAAVRQSLQNALAALG
jgi:hypothetical protein